MELLNGYNEKTKELKDCPYCIGIKISSFACTNCEYFIKLQGSSFVYCSYNDKNE